MGLPAQLVQILIYLHAESPLRGPVLTLGRQDIEECSYERILTMFAQQGVVPVPLSQKLLARQDVSLDVLFFAHLGLEVQALDYSSYESADFVHNLNDPIPAEWHGKFGTVIDGGTLEHVFDVRQSLKNTADLLAEGGRVIHISPSNNYVNHGFWQFSPTLFFDYYGVNAFDGAKAMVIMHPRDDLYNAQWSVIGYDHALDYGLCSFFNSVDSQLITLFSASKTAASTSDKIPTQTWYSRLNAGLPLSSRRETYLEYGPEGLKLSRRNIVLVPADLAAPALELSAQS